MKATIVSTDKVVTMNGVPCRIWEGTTGGDQPIIAFIVRVTPGRAATDVSEFARDLAEVATPSLEAAAFPPRMTL